MPFSDEDDFMRDVQIVIDENYVNDYFLNLFHSSEVISLTETLSGYLPRKGITGSAAKIALQLFMSTTVWKKWFPTLGEEYKIHRQIDLRCGFSKSFIQGKLQDTHIT